MIIIFINYWVQDKFYQKMYHVKTDYILKCRHTHTYEKEWLNQADEFDVITAV